MSELITGYTLMHEHITIDLSSIKQDKDCRLDCFSETVEELKELYQYGVRNIVDVTNIGMGRNPEYVKKAEALTGIRMIQSTGYYKEPFLPEHVYSDSEERLAERMIHEIRDGIEYSGIRAGLIGEIGTSKNKMSDMEKKVFKASILASLETQTPISTHTTLGTFGVEQVNYLIERGISPQKIIIGHMDLGSKESIWDVLATGVYIGFDTIGKENYFPDNGRVELLLELEHRSLLNQVVLSMDITRVSHLKHSGGIGYGHLFTSFLPGLRKAGMKESSIEQMLMINPQQIFRQEQLK